jgi:rare lipoprotein A
MITRRTPSALARPGLLGAALVLASCSTIDLSVRDEPPVLSKPLPPVASAPAQPAKKPGGYYQDDGPAERIPEGLLETPDAEPKVEPMLKGPSKPYTIFDQTYVPITDGRPYVQRGVGSWYGRKFHGQKTASGEIYDMFKMTAAHTTLPLPSYVRVTNLRNGRQVIVRVNDRGPFHSARIIDLSYTAALKLDIVRGGSAELEVERLLPDEIARLQSAKQKTRQQLQAAIGADELIARSLPTEVKTDSAPALAIPGFYLQFGAYAQQSNAMAMRERLLAGWPSQLPSPVVVQHQGLYRLHSGPFGSRALADEASLQLQGTSQIKTTIVQR